MPDFGNDTLSSLKINSKSAGSREISRPNLVSMLCGRDLHSAQAKIDLLDTALQLLHRFADIYKGLDGFVELYQPVVDVLQSLTVLDMPMALRVQSIPEAFTLGLTLIAFLRNGSRTCRRRCSDF